MSVRAILRGGTHQKAVDAGGLCALEIALWAIYGLFLVWGCRRLMCTNSGVFGGVFGAVHGHIMELEGPRGTFGIGKSMPHVYPLFPFIWPFSATSRAVLGKKRLILALNCRF